MIKIKLFCSAGMSTSILVQRMREAAKEKDIAVEVSAHSVRSLEKELDDCDVVLLGPQVAYILNVAKEMCEPLGISVGDIPGLDYGIGDGKRVLQYTLSLIEKDE